MSRVLIRPIGMRSESMWAMWAQGETMHMSAAFASGLNGESVIAAVKNFLYFASVMHSTVCLV